MKEQHVIVRVSPQEKKQLQALASASNTTMSRYIRGIIRTQKATPRLDAQQLDQLKKLYFEIGKIGTNINQVAYHINRKFHPDHVMTEEEYSAFNETERAVLQEEMECLRELLFSVRHEVATVVRQEEAA